MGEISSQFMTERNQRVLAITLFSQACYSFSVGLSLFACTGFAVFILQLRLAGKINSGENPTILTSAAPLIDPDPYLLFFCVLLIGLAMFFMFIGYCATLLLLKKK